MNPILNKDLDEPTATLINITKYFSNNSIYSIYQLENYFATDFEISDRGALNESILSPRDNTSDTNIKNILLRTNNDSGQIMSITFKDPLIFDNKNFHTLMINNGYDFYGLTRSHSLRSAYTKKLSDQFELGKVFVVFDVEDNRIEVIEISFKTNYRDAHDPTVKKGFDWNHSK